jgi:hypothetical protein
VVQPPGQTGPPEIGKPCCSRQIGEISWKPKKLGYGKAHSYLDDSLLKEFDSEILSRHTFLFIRLLLDLGFLISWKKSQILPSQDFLFLSKHFPCESTNLGEEVRQEE